jgi:hypothetical protein
MTVVLSVSVDSNLRYRALPLRYIPDRHGRRRMKIYVTFNFSYGGGQLVEIFRYSAPGDARSPIII